jgi:hypothetical protein
MKYFALFIICGIILLMVIPYIIGFLFSLMWTIFDILIILLLAYFATQAIKNRFKK